MPSLDLHQRDLAEHLQSSHALEQAIGIAVTSKNATFIVMRVDRRGEIPPTYLRTFALSGRNGARQLRFGARDSAHRFETRAEAEDIARRLRRRVSAEEHDYVVIELAEAAKVPS